MTYEDIASELTSVKLLFNLDDYFSNKRHKIDRYMFYFRLGPTILSDLCRSESALSNLIIINPN